MMDDLISRQEAIDVLLLGKEILSRVLDDIDVVGTDREKYSWGLGLIESNIKDIEELPSVQPGQQWIPCSDRLPNEEDSMFAKFYGTDKWRNAMMRKRSKRVIATIEYSDGSRQTDVASTSDGRWVNSISVIDSKVIAWMPLPEPYKGE